jgi:RNA polymerase sigma factor (sigma-70 family)
MATVFVRARTEPAPASAAVVSPPEDRTISVHALMVRARGIGDAADQALEDFLTALCPPLRQFARGRVRGWADANDVAEDVVQEALIRIAKAVRECRAETDAQVLGWARTTARHALIDMYRSPGSGLAARQLAQELIDDMAGYAATQGEEAPDRSSPALASLLKVVMAAYGDAVEATGELFWWRLIMGLEWSEIAERFSTSAAGAKRRFQRAQETLRREVVRRVDLLPAAERHEVLALLTRFGYAESLAEPASEALCRTDSADPERSGLDARAARKSVGLELVISLSGGAAA